MLNIYRVDDSSNIIALAELAQDCWADLSDPAPEELDRIAADLEIPRDFLTDSLDPAERSHMLTEGHNCVIITRVSSRTGDENGVPFTTLPVGMIITPRAIVTVCRKPDLVYKLVDKKLRGARSRERFRLALTLLQQNSIVFIKHLQELDQLIGEIERNMSKSMSNDEIRRMMHIEKTLVYFLTSLKGNAMVLDKMYNSTALNIEPAERELLIDALTESKQAVEMAEVYLQIIGSMSETFAAMISNNMNSVVKFLTGITLILMAPSIIVGLYGMNVPLPWQESPFALPGIIAGTLAVCWGLWRYLSKKHWM